MSSSNVTSHASVIHRATIQGAGVGNGRTIYEGHYEVTETCCPQPIRDGAELGRLLRSWVDAVVSRL
ncbi:MAG: hypothetical protein FJW39_06600 [Acidobacteria bacterium]|nr:hypothetical protein [Acidobacteriota bacterium]